MEDHRVAHVQDPALDGAGYDSPVIAAGGELVDILHRHPERLLYCAGLGTKAVENLQCRWAGVPRHGAR
jgi:hypothetical protein